MLEPEFRLVDPADCLASDDEPVEQRLGIDLLRENLRLRGQVTPVLLAPHPTEPKMIYIDGHGRGFCLSQLGQKMKALVFPRPLTPAELIEFKFSNNLIRRTMSAEEIGLECARYIELSGCTQSEMASRLSVSDATISRCLARIKRIPDGYEAMARQLGPSFVAIILGLKDPEMRKRAFEYATKPHEGRKPKREQLATFVDQLKGKKPKGKAARKKRLRFVVEGREFLVDQLPGDTAETVIESFRAVANQLHKHRDLKLEAVAAGLLNQELA